MTVLRTLCRLAPLVLVAVLLRPVAAQDGEPLEIGAALPLADVTLESATGAATSLAAEAGGEGLAVIFWSNTCPWVAKYEDRVLALAEEYVPAGIGIVLVNSNDPADNADEGFDAIRQHATDAGYAIPYLVDEGSRLAQAFGATRTPQVFLFDTTDRLVYEGTVDDSPSDAAQVEEEYFSDAMDQLIAGATIAVQKTKAFGCTIKFY